MWGAGGHAKVVADAARSAGAEIVGFLDDQTPDRWGSSFCGAIILGSLAQLPVLARDYGVDGVALGVGDNAARLQAVRSVVRSSLVVATVVHPAAVLAQTVRLGAGVFIAAGAVVNPDVEIQDAVIVNTSASVDHDCVLEAGCHICPGATLAGWVRIGQGALIGTGAIVTPGVSIGAGTVLGAGGVAIRNLPSDVVAYGVPARPLRRTESGREGD